jgi:hypothetical protein
MRKAFIAALAVLLAFVVGACSTVSTSASEVALQYEGGAFDSSAYFACFGDSTKEYNDVGDNHYYYPTGQRDFSFSNDEGKHADSAALTATTKNLQDVKVEGTVKFTMKLSCEPFKDPSGKSWPGGTAQMFHELYGAKAQAYNEDGGQAYGQGWSNLLNEYLGFAVDQSVDDATLTLTLDELRAGDGVKVRWQNQAKDNLTRAVKSLTGGVEIFKITEVLLQRPGVNPKIADAEAQRQASQILADASGIDRKTAETWPGGITAYLEYKRQQALNEAIKDGKIKVIPVPYGSDVVVQPGG